MIQKENIFFSKKCSHSLSKCLIDYGGVNLVFCNSVLYRKEAPPPHTLCSVLLDVVYRGPYVSAHVLLNLFHELVQRV